MLVRVVLFGSSLLGVSSMQRILDDLSSWLTESRIQMRCSSYPDLPIYLD